MSNDFNIVIFQVLTETKPVKKYSGYFVYEIMGRK